MRLIIPLKLITLLTLLVISTNTFALQWYHVELVVFERESGNYAEQWPEMDNVRQGSYSPGTANGRIQPASIQKLVGVANKLNSTRGYNVLYHSAWKQPILNKGSAKSVSIKSSNGLIEGVLKLYRLTYVSADIDIWLKQNTPTMNSFSDGLSASSETVQNPHLQELRRVKSNELVYFDHPKVAAILQLTPVKAPGQAIADTPETYSVSE